MPLVISGGSLLRKPGGLATSTACCCEKPLICCVCPDPCAYEIKASIDGTTIDVDNNRIGLENLCGISPSATYTGAGYVDQIVNEIPSLGLIYSGPSPRTSHNTRKRVDHLGGTVLSTSLFFSVGLASSELFYVTGGPFVDLVAGESFLGSVQNFLKVSLSIQAQTVLRCQRPQTPTEEPVWTLQKPLLLTVTGVAQATVSQDPTPENPGGGFGVVESRYTLSFATPNDPVPFEELETICLGSTPNDCGASHTTCLGGNKRESRQSPNALSASPVVDGEPSAVDAAGQFGLRPANAAMVQKIADLFDAAKSWIENYTVIFQHLGVCKQGCDCANAAPYVTVVFDSVFEFLLSDLVNPQEIIVGKTTWIGQVVSNNCYLFTRRRYRYEQPGPDTRANEFVSIQLCCEGQGWSAYQIKTCYGYAPELVGEGEQQDGYTEYRHIKTWDCVQRSLPGGGTTWLPCVVDDEWTSVPNYPVVVAPEFNGTQTDCSGNEGLSFHLVCQ